MKAMSALKPTIVSALLCGVTALAPAACGQSSAAADLSALSKARSLYYVPVDKGLQSFHCEVRFDWKDLMEKAANQQVPDTDDRLRYLQSVSLSVDDDLRGTGELHWQAPNPAPEGTEESVTKIRDGLRQMWSGFFQSWNSFVTGDLTSVDPKSSMERNASGGYHVAAREASGIAEEQYDTNLLLQSVHVSSTALESTISPTFTPSPQGLLVTIIRSTYKQPPSGPPTEVLMQLNYAPVGNFQLPSELQVAVGPAQFTFHLVNCTVKTQLTRP